MTRTTPRERAWDALTAHQKIISTEHMQQWFKQDPARFSHFSLNNSDILLDYSKNRVAQETMRLLFRLANTCSLPEKINDLFKGVRLNQSERRAALHTALRAPKGHSLTVNDQDIMHHIHATLDAMRVITEKIRSKAWRGVTGKSITDIVNIGIGGSHLGSLAAISALSDYTTDDLQCHFISNVDSAHIHAVLKKINPETTLFIISSKSFTTLETMTNAKTVLSWLRNTLGINDISAHVIAVTACPDKAIALGIPETHILTLWDWVGGRFSVWSAIGLPLALLIGMDCFLEFLNGAHEMDNHFKSAPFENNMPVIMGLLGIWYINFFNATHHAIIPYSHHLHYFRMYIQQLDMESSGKSYSQSGEEIDFLTGPVIIGAQGCHGQHAFHQLFHQGRHLIPVDFILVAKERHPLDGHQSVLVSSGLSQAAALMQGQSLDTHADNQAIAKQKIVPGNRPSNTLFLESISPQQIGALFALYEHKTFVQGVIWDINSFDQWGVELGKKLLPSIFNQLQSDAPSDSAALDGSTAALVQYYKDKQKI